MNPVMEESVVSTNQRHALKTNKSISKRSGEDIDCGDKSCFVEYILLPDCYLYIHEHNDTKCEIPCNLEFCCRELHHYISCPVWHCTSHTTTTTTKTTTTTSPLSTSTTSVPASTMKPLQPDHPALVFASYALNIVLIVCLIFVIIGKCKKAILKCWTRFRNRNQNHDNDDNDQTPILRNSRSRTAFRSTPSTSTRARGFQRLRDNNDQMFSLDDVESEDENQSTFERIGLRTPAQSPRVNSAFNTPPPQASSLDPLAHVRPENLPLSTFGIRVNTGETRL
jgi:hypothetical protein